MAALRILSGLWLQDRAMYKAQKRSLIGLLLALAMLGIAGCGSSSSGSGNATGSASSAIAGGQSQSDAASAATGDIPDNQVFLTFHSSKAGYSIQYPEGWTQKGNANDVTFSDKGNTVRISVAAGPPATVASVAAGLDQLKKTDQTVVPGAPAAVSLKHDQAIKVTYAAQAAPDPVTGKRAPLVVDRYVYSHGGRVATVDLGTVRGVDNVDAYRLISNSFSWS